MILSITDNPLSIAAAGQVTITPVFVIPLPIPGRPPTTDLSNAAIVQILPSAGGTTIPKAGTYALANAEKFDLIAMPNEGWQFSHWTICGPDTPHGSSPTNWSPTDNPYNVNHGYGATYIYQAVFVPVGSTEPTPTPIPEFSSIATIIIAITLAAITFGTYTFRRKTK